MKVEKSKLSGSKYCVIWKDGSRSHYSSKKIAIREMRREIIKNIRRKK